jgi:glycosyltransferase involved in cell wall biosynthesis
MADLDPRVGVIIPTLNAARYLARAIESVTAQHPAPIDIVVVDGGSTDDSVAVARSYSAVRVIHQRGRGLGSARNQGLAVVAGDYVGFCDADDRWSAHAIASRLNAFEHHPDAVVVIGRLRFDSLDGTTPTTAQARRVGKTRTGFTPGALLARRAAFKQIGDFDEHMTIGSDTDWFVRLQQSSLQVLCIDDVVLHKTARHGSLSTDVDTYRRELMTVARRFIDEQRKPGRR